MQLFLTVYTTQCHRALCYPENQSEYRVEDLHRLLQLTGFVIPSQTSYNDLIHLLIRNLPTQIPVLYAVDTGEYYLFHGRDIQLINGELKLSISHKSRPIPQNNNCLELFEGFKHHLVTEDKTFVPSAALPTEALRKKQEQIVALEAKIRKMEMQLTPSAHNQQENMEKQKMLQHLYQQQDKLFRSYQELQQKNMTLLQEVQRAKTQEHLLREELQKYRSMSERKPYEWEKYIKEIQRLQSELANCQAS